MIPKNVEITGIDVCYHQFQALLNARANPRALILRASEPIAL